jgi:hypothetical protein
VRLAAKLTHWRIDIKSESETEADLVRQEAIRRAEMAFQSPQRLAAEAAMAAKPAGDDPAVEEASSAGSETVPPAAEGGTSDVTSHDTLVRPASESLEPVVPPQEEGAEAPGAALEDTEMVPDGVPAARDETAEPAGGYEEPHETHA